MAKENSNLIICNNFYEAIKSLTDENAGKLFKSVFHYHLTGEYEQQNDIVNFAFLTFKDLIDENHYKYQEKCKKNKENIKKYWENKRTNTKENERNQMNTNIKENKIRENKIKEENIKENIINNIPTKEEIENYCNLTARNIDIDTFYKYYNDLDWQDDYGNVINWKRYVNSWHLREEKNKCKVDEKERLKLVVKKMCGG